nr:MAG TPA: Baseplate component [Caudoviricetes sp.]
MIELANGISLPEGAVVQSIVCHMDNAREYSAIVERIQYDKTLPVIEVYLSSGGVPYEVPENATVSVRLRKGDGKGVYNPALGLSEDRTRVYITITQQMTAVPGNCRAVVEVAAGGGVICASEFLLKVTENPVQEGAIESEDEYLTLTEILAQVQQMHGDVEGWKDQTLDYKKQAESMAINAVASASRAADSATNAADSAAQAGTSATNAANSAAQAEEASEHYPTISSDGYWQLWDPASGKYVKTTQKAQGPEGPTGPPVDTSTLISQAEKGAANGVATLDSGAKVPVPQIPAANSLQVLNLGPIPTSDRLQTGQDLNDYTTSGSYWCATSAIAESLINCPYKGRFKLVVDDVSSGGEIVYQYIIPGHTNYHAVFTPYYRVRDAFVTESPWGLWRTMMSVVEGNQGSIKQTSALLNLRQEEGTWTPVLIARSGPAVSYTITENRGCKYWTLGDWVYITCYLRVRITAAGDGSSGSRSYAGIQGLPFAVSTESRYPITVTELYGCVSNNWDVGYIDDDGGSSVYFQKDDGAAQEWWMVNSSSTDGGINFCGWYKKAT